MSLFLQVVPVSKAIEEIRNLAVRCGDERVPLNEAFHRILAQDVRADVDIPGFTRSVVDGFAVRSADTTGAGDVSRQCSSCWEGLQWEIPDITAYNRVSVFMFLQEESSRKVLMQ